MIQMFLNAIDSSLCLLHLSLNIDEQICICVNVCFPSHLVKHAGLLCGGDFKLLCLYLYLIVFVRLRLKYIVV